MTEATGRERVLREAMRLFGASGVEGTSVRTVAAAAGVSPANVIHHFGSKQALREAIDTSILEGYRSTLTEAAQAIVAGVVPDLGDVIADPAARGYLRRALLDGGSEPVRLMTEIADVVRAGLDQLAARGQLREGTELDYATVQVLALLLGPLLLGPLLPDVETAAPSPAVVQRRAAADVMLLRHGLLSNLDSPVKPDDAD